MERSEELSYSLKCLKEENPDGMITKNNIIDLLKVSIADEKAEIVANLIFAAFDKDDSGTINFQELTMVTNSINTTMLEEKLHWVFQMFDKNGSESIQLGEMVEIFSMLYICEGLEESLAVERAEQVFNLLDSNNDGDVTEEEFVNGCLDDDDLVKELTGEAKEKKTIKERFLLPRNSVSVENRCTTKRRYVNRK